MKSIRAARRRVEFVCDDPNLTPAAGLATVAELDRVLGIMELIDEEVPSLYRPGARYRPYSAAKVVMGIVESQLAGGDFLCDIDDRRKDTAGASLRAVPCPPASTTVGYLGKRFTDKHFAGLEAANAVLVARAMRILPDAERARLYSRRPSIDLDPTDVEVYGRKKRGFAFNHAGQRCGRPHPAFWAGAGMMLACELGSGTDDPRPQAPRLIARSIAALPPGLAKPIVRADSGFFDLAVAEAALGAGADFAIAAKRNPAVWRSLRQIEKESWKPALGMEGAEVAECSYRPEGWPPCTRAIVRRVRVEAEEIRSDPRSRRRRTIDPEELKAVREGRADHAYAYVVILTSLDWSAVEIEAWFRDRAQVEERLKDSKLGMALRHLPSGYPAVNALWMWSAFLALSISALLSAFARQATLDDEATTQPGASDTSGAVENQHDSRQQQQEEEEEEETVPDMDEHAGVEASRRSRRGEPLRAHGKRLRREIINVPGRLAHHARGLVVHLHPFQEGGSLVRVYELLAALPPWASP